MQWFMGNVLCHYLKERFAKTYPLIIGQNEQASSGTCKRIKNPMNFASVNV